METLIEALTAEGCEVSYPRYPLLHQQPLFTEGLYAEIGAFACRQDFELPKYLPNALPNTEAANSTFIRLPSFPFADYPLLQQYVLAFQKVVRSGGKINQNREE